MGPSAENALLWNRASINEPAVRVYSSKRSAYPFLEGAMLGYARL